MSPCLSSLSVFLAQNSRHRTGDVPSTASIRRPSWGPATSWKYHQGTLARQSAAPGSASMAPAGSEHCLSHGVLPISLTREGVASCMQYGESVSTPDALLASVHSRSPQDCIPYGVGIRLNPTWGSVNPTCGSVKSPARTLEAFWEGSGTRELTRRERNT